MNDKTLKPIEEIGAEIRAMPTAEKFRLAAALLESGVIPASNARRLAVNTARMAIAEVEGRIR